MHDTPPPAATAAPASATPPTAAPVVPPLARDPWAWLSALAVLALVLASRGAPLGVPVAEDFDFLHRALLEPTRTLLDGGGSLAFWRPLSHQLYYLALGPLMLSHPLAVAALHALLLALAAVLLTRALRPALGGPLAAAVGTFPLLAESTRTLLTWPSHFVDLGLYLFSALAVHEAARRRLPTALAALVAALLCKELAVVTVVLLPFVPGLMGGPGVRGERARWLAGCGAVLVVWAAAYTWVRAHAGLELPHDLERDSALLAVSPLERLAWAWRNSLRAVFSLAAAPGRWDPAIGGALWLVALASAVVFARSAAARARLRARAGLVAWGLAWALLGAATLASIFPLWSPNRSQYASVGFGAGAVTLAAAAHPALAGALVALRLGAFALAPPADRVITPEPAERGAFIDFPRITRLQRVMRDTRGVLAERFPTLPHGARVGFHNLPLTAEYAFGDSRALQAWYRDTTLRWVPFAAWRADSLQPVAAFVDYQPAVRPGPQMVLIETDALRAKLEGTTAIRQGRWPDALAALDRARALQRDTNAFIFLGDVTGRRAYTLVALRRYDEARGEAHAALAAWPLDVGARFVVALLLGQARRRDAALAQLDTLLSLSPQHAEALALRRLLVEGVAPPGTAVPPPAPAPTSPTSPAP